MSAAGIIGRTAVGSPTEGIAWFSARSMSSPRIGMQFREPECGGSAARRNGGRAVDRSAGPGTEPGSVSYCQ